MGRSAYLDTNVYFVGLTRLPTNSSLLLQNTDRFTPILCAYLLEEVVELFRRQRGRSDAGRARHFLLGLPARWVEDPELESRLPDLWETVTDEDDRPHIAACLASRADHFVTTNRRLTQMAVRRQVRFSTPREFTEALGLRGLDTVRGV